MFLSLACQKMLAFKDSKFPNHATKTDSGKTMLTGGKYDSHQCIILTILSLSKNPCFQWRETQACDCKIPNHSSGCVWGFWPANQAEEKRVSLYQSQKRPLFLGSNMKNYFILKGEPFPLKKKKFSNSKKHLLFKKKQGFWQARHMTTCPACVGLPTLILIQKPIIGAISTKISARKIRFSCFWK